MVKFSIFLSNTSANLRSSFGGEPKKSAHGTSKVFNL